MTSLKISPGDLEMVFRLKHGDPRRTGPGPRRRHAFSYYTPDDVYEALIARLVQPGTAWLDVGGGRAVLPENPRLARALADRCQILVGVDPSDNVRENPFLHEAVQSTIEDYRCPRQFDLATLRMVAEHIDQPARAVASLSTLIRPGGRVVVYTVNRWSPVPLLTGLVPHRLHHPIKSALWGTEEKDTFPVAYRMNTRGRLAALFGAGGFRECFFTYLDDCRTFHRYPLIDYLELSARSVLRALGIPYPENCLLGVYQR